MLLQRLLIVLVAFSASSSYAAIIKDVRLWRAPDHTRVVLDLSAAVEHNISTLQNPHRIVIDIDRATMKVDTSKLDFSDSPIVKIRRGVKNKHDLRIVLDMSTAVKPRSFLLKANREFGDRLVIDLYDGAKRKQKIKVVEENGRRDIVVAIAAGHGGIDPGASGPNRLREKTVVLAIAKELNYLLKNKDGYKPVMIRKGDYSVGLKKRRDLARSAGADLMVSIHADAFSDKRAYGSSVYVLSSRGATSAAAKFLATEANSSDIFSGISLSDKNDELISVLTDLSMSASLDVGLRVGAKVVKAMGKVSRLHSKKVEQANFSVLRSPDIPSILVETGFISNPGEAKKLNSKPYQRKMARAIFTGISQHFEALPPPDTLLAWQKRNRQLTVEYTITRGDTLSAIARKYRVSIASIRRKNDMASNTIKVGQRILIPAS